MPHACEEIYSKKKRSQPNSIVTKISISSIAIFTEEIVCFGHTSTLEPKVGEKQRPNIVSSIFGDIVEEFLDPYNETMRIEEITKYIFKYRQQLKVISNQTIGCKEGPD